MLTLDQILLSHADSSIQIGDGTDFLAVNGDGSINAVISATDLDIRDLTHVSDSIKVGDGTDFLAVNGDGSINSVVSATDLDIRDLDAAQDNVAISDGTDTLAVNADGSINVTFSVPTADDAPDAGNPLKIGGRAHSGVLAAVSASGDRFDMIGDMYRRQYVNTSYAVGLKTSSATVTTTAAEVLATPLAGRRSVTIQNKGNQSVFLVHSGATAKTDGLEIPKYASATFEFSDVIDMFLVADSGSQDVRLLEAA